MRKNLYIDQEMARDDGDVADDAAPVSSWQPISRGLLTSQRFGVRGRRFHPADVLDWIKRGALTRVS